MSHMTKPLREYFPESYDKLVEEAEESFFMGTKLKELSREDILFVCAKAREYHTYQNASKDQLVQFLKDINNRR